MRIVRLTVQLLLVSAFCCTAGILSAGSVAKAGALRISLLASAQVQGDAVLLANFLPPQAPANIRVSAESVSLGASPQIGSFRRFSRSAVAVALQNAGFSPDAFLVPEFLIARRSGKFLTQEDAFAAIQAVFARTTNANLTSFRPEDLLLDSQIAVPETGSGFDVTQMSFDSSIRRARFRLRLRNSPSVPPFYVTAPIPAAPSRMDTLSSMTAMPPGTLNSLLPDSPLLVEPRQLARLHLHSKNSTMLLVVRPLQPGRLNETIRVRLATSGRTLQAKVIAANSLDAVF